MVIKILFATLTLLSLHARAETLFEGYYKVTSGGVHVGYIIARYEYDEKKKQFLSTTFTKTNDLGNNLTESLKTVSTQDMEPVSYSYTTLMGGKTKAIDAKFEKGKMTATVQQDGKSQKIIKDVPKGTFLSAVMIYMILRSKDGLKDNMKYDFQAVVEEEAEILKGVSNIKGHEEINGIKALKANNEFKDTKYITLLTDNGETLATRIPANQLTAELVPVPAQATGTITVPNALVKALFGDVPAGTKNVISKSSKEAPAAPAPPVPGKHKGIPQGKGLHLKGGAPEEKESESTKGRTQ